MLSSVPGVGRWSSGIEARPDLNMVLEQRVRPERRETEDCSSDHEQFQDVER
jgi:hypothetical protein